ncbi:hypothetical protein MUP01_10655 [Candidatus Bathyarchaeota archaeon]|nr:hypothetical protein [Candidatus Bathyarchaeota archaeon]
MKKKETCLFIVGLVLACLLMPTLSLVHASGVYEASLDLQTYQTTKITFNFPYTNNASIGEVTTIGRGVYKYEGSATYLTFIADDVDEYSFQLRIHYEANQTTSNVTLSRTVIVGLWSGNLPSDGYLYRSDASDFIITVRLSVTRQPTYPSKDEVAAEVVHQVEQKLVIQTEENRKLMEQITSTLYVCIALVFIAVVMSMTSFVLAGLASWRRRASG